MSKIFCVCLVNKLGKISASNVSYRPKQKHTMTKQKLQNKISLNYSGQNCIHATCEAAAAEHWSDSERHSREYSIKEGELMNLMSKMASSFILSIPIQDSMSDNWHIN